MIKHGYTYNHQGPARVDRGLWKEEMHSIHQPGKVEKQGSKGGDADAQANDHLLCLLVLQSDLCREGELDDNEAEAADEDEGPDGEGEHPDAHSSVAVVLNNPHNEGKKAKSN